jgi:hypothetical protein
MKAIGGADLDTLAEPFLAKAYRLAEIIDRDGLPFVLFEARRTFTKQQQYFMRGRAVKAGLTVVVDRSQIITKARPGTSAHNWGLAVDFVLDTDPKHPFWHGDTRPIGMWDTGYANGKCLRPACKLAWERYGLAAEHVGLEWGGRWKFTDMPHSQLRGWETLRPKDWKDVVLRELAAGR